MRLSVLGGEWAGRRLAAPKGKPIRPTSQQVREAVFDLLGPAVAGARLCDLFAGSGALGIEALSRGAAACTFVESAPFSLRAIRESLETLAPGPDRQAVVVRGEVLKTVPKLALQGAVFDGIFMDPPYRKSLAGKSLIALAHHAILAPEGWVVVEHDRREDLPAEVGSPGLGAVLKLRRRARYGDTCISIYLRQP